MNFREQAASLFLANDNITEALEILDDVALCGVFPEGVYPSEMFEYELPENVTMMIDQVTDLLERAYNEGALDR